MGSYWDYLQDAAKYPLSSGPAAFLHAWYNKSYDESHGAKRYYLSKLHPLATVRRIRDAAQKAQDAYDNTGRDPAYIDRIDGPGAGAILGDVGAGAAIPGMARSLTDVYRAEVIEDVNKKFNGSYR